MKLGGLLLLVVSQALLSESVDYEGKFFWNLFFRPKRDVKFYLYTRRNAYAGQEVLSGDMNSVVKSTFNPKNPTKFLIHGWRGDYETTFNEKVSTEFLIKDDVNIFRVDWSTSAQTINYLTAARRVPGVGKVLGEFIDFLNANSAVDLNTVTIIGFSLGAHVAGFAGKNVQRGKVRAIIGLDPAGPLFNSKDAEGRLDYSDASYVEVIHTNMGMTGMDKLIGHTDFIANGGTHQPGCLTDSCSHHRAPQFYIESINMNPFWARRCDSHANIKRGDCKGELILMGDLNNATKNLTGIFHFNTNRNTPFSQSIPEI
ncbi:hypothetical protein ACKWTF_010343 [Chironomus riparius]